MVSARDIRLEDGRTLQVYDSGAADDFTLLWHHGAPQTGAPLDPLLTAAARRGIRLLSYARPAYGGSSPDPGRDVASAAADVAQLADALGVGRFEAVGASWGGPHALACAALLRRTPIDDARLVDMKVRLDQSGTGDAALGGVARSSRP